MTKQELQQIRHLHNEIRLLTEDLKNYSKKYKAVRDTVIGSRRCVPYDLHAISVIGYIESDSEYEEKTKKLKKRLRQIKTELRRLDEYIETIPDSQMRQIMELRYGKNLTWQQVAREIGEHDESYPRRRHNAFLNLPNLPKISV